MARLVHLVALLAVLAAPSCAADAISRKQLQEVAVADGTASDEAMIDEDFFLPNPDMEGDIPPNATAWLTCRGVNRTGDVRSIPGWALRERAVAQGWPLDERNVASPPFRMANETGTYVSRDNVTWYAIGSAGERSSDNDADGWDSDRKPPNGPFWMGNATGDYYSRDNVTWWLVGPDGRPLFNNTGVGREDVVDADFLGAKQAASAAETQPSQRLPEFLDTLAAATGLNLDTKVNETGTFVSADGGATWHAIGEGEDRWEAGTLINATREVLSQNNLTWIPGLEDILEKPDGDGGFGENDWFPGMADYVWYRMNASNPSRMEANMTGRWETQDNMTWYRTGNSTGEGEELHFVAVLGALFYSKDGENYTACADLSEKLEDVKDKVVDIVKKKIKKRRAKFNANFPNLSLNQMSDEEKDAFKDRFRVDLAETFAHLNVTKDNVTINSLISGSVIVDASVEFDNLEEAEVAASALESEDTVSMFSKDFVDTFGAPTMDRVQAVEEDVEVEEEVVVDPTWRADEDQTLTGGDDVVESGAENLVDSENAGDDTTTTNPPPPSPPPLSFVTTPNTNGAASVMLQSKMLWAFASLMLAVGLSF